jgi:predicted glycosyltransferase
LKAEQEAPDGRIIITRPYSSVDVSKDEANCAAAITRGGYNTTFELVSCGRPFVVVPHTSAKNDEGNMRADILETCGLAKKFSPDNLAANPDAAEHEKEMAARKLADMLDMSRSCQVASIDKPEYNGAKRMAEKLVELACRQREQNAGSSVEGISL